MKNTIYTLIAFVLFGCTTTKLFKEYELYRRDKTINYPEEKLTLKFVSDTTGLFINTDNGREAFTQKISFSKVNNDYLIVEEIVPISSSRISLKQGDTIVVDKKRLHFFYDGDKKYLLSFRKK